MLRARVLALRTARPVPACSCAVRCRVRRLVGTNPWHATAEIAKLALSITEKWAKALIAPKTGTDGAAPPKAKGASGATGAAATAAASAAKATGAGTSKQSVPTSAPTPPTIQTPRDQRMAGSSGVGATAALGAAPPLASPLPLLPEVKTFRSEPSPMAQPELFRAPSALAAPPSSGTPVPPQGELYKSTPKGSGSILARPHEKGDGRLKKEGKVKFAATLEQVRRARAVAGGGYSRCGCLGPWCRAARHARVALVSGGV